MKKILLRHLNNFAQIIFSLGFLYLAFIFFEYEIAKIQNPAVLFLITPRWLDLVLSGIVGLVSLIDLAVVILVYYKKLEVRFWIWWLILVQASLLAIIFTTLGWWRFEHILLPGKPWLS